MDGVRDDSNTKKSNLNREPIAGVMSRLAIMACLHFDFRLALRYTSDVEDIPMAADNRGGRNPQHHFAEEEINKKIFGNILNSLKDIETK